MKLNSKRLLTLNLSEKKGAYISTQNSVSAKYCETTPKYALFSVTARYAARAKLVWYKVGLSVKMAKVINIKKCQFRIIFSAKINKKKDSTQDSTNDHTLLQNKIFI